MKTTIFAVILLLQSSFAFSQINSQTPWTWMKGDNIIDQTGIYGIQGIASVNNKPGGRDFSATWRDNDNNLWLLGGMGYSLTTSQGYLNDLWKYNIVTNTWTWMKGSNTINQNSVYGSQGVANTANFPGAVYSSISWSDANNDLWLFGGFGYTDNNFGFLNSLWKYNTTANTWTWVKGDKLIDKRGVYGSKGVANSNNKPGARYGSQTWVDNTGYLWLYGGYGYSNSEVGILNDLWKYDPLNNEWTWINGNNTADQSANYGVKGVPCSSNIPGARYVSTSWKDSDGSFWLFGGYGYSENQEGILNDLWKYDPITNTWTWMNGDKLTEQTAVYGCQGLANPISKPGARYVSDSWIDLDGELCLLNGYGYDATGAGFLNDVWKYNTNTNQWKWIKGDSMVDQTGIYGTQGMPEPANKSGARNGSLSWTDNTGNLWLFGGYGYDNSSSGVLNDLWKINTFQVPLPLHLLQFSGVLNNNRVQLKWESVNEYNFSHYTIERSHDGIHFDSLGVVYGAGNSDKNNYAFTDDKLKNQSGAVIYYRLQLTDIDHRFIYSKILKFDLLQSVSEISVFPNPATHTITISLSQQKTDMLVISFISTDGKIIKRQFENSSSGKNSISMDISSLPSGSYRVTIKSSTGIIKKHFIKQ